MTTMNRVDQRQIARRLAATLVQIIWLPIVFLPGLAGVAAEREPGVTIAVDCDQVIQTMRGGFGVSWHAIEEPIPVVAAARTEAVRGAGIRPPKMNKRGANLSSRGLAGTRLHPRRGGAADVPAGTRPVYLGLA